MDSFRAAHGWITEQSETDTTPAPAAARDRARTSPLIDAQIHTARTLDPRRTRARVEQASKLTPGLRPFERTASTTTSTPRSACLALTPSCANRRRLPVASCGVVSGCSPVVVGSDEVQGAAVEPADDERPPLGQSPRRHRPNGGDGTTADARRAPRASWPGPRSSRRTTCSALRAGGRRLQQLRA